jgi:large subunit ribosomal protein L9
MKVILRQDMEKLGKMGSIVKVKDGYARNFLFPRQLAIPATARNIKYLKDIERQNELKLQKIKAEAQQLAERLDGLSVNVQAQAGRDDRLYGSITAADIAQALEKEGFALNKKEIILNEPIKALGVYEVLIKLHPEVQARIKVWVVKK